MSECLATSTLQTKKLEQLADIMHCKVTSLSYRLHRARPHDFCIKYIKKHIDEDLGEQSHCIRSICLDASAEVTHLFAGQAMNSMHAALRSLSDTESAAE